MVAKGNSAHSRRKSESGRLGGSVGRRSLQLWKKKIGDVRAISGGVRARGRNGERRQRKTKCKRQFLCETLCAEFTLVGEKALLLSVKCEAPAIKKRRAPKELGSLASLPVDDGSRRQRYVDTPRRLGAARIPVPAANCRASVSADAPRTESKTNNYCTAF